MIVKKVYAQLQASDLGVNESLGGIESLRTALIWPFNLFKWLGWSGVVVGIGFALFMGIYAIVFGDNEEVVSNAKNAIVKAVLMIILGILLLSAGYFLKVVGGLVNESILFEIPESL